MSTLRYDTDIFPPKVRRHFAVRRGTSIKDFETIAAILRDARTVIETWVDCMTASHPAHPPVLIKAGVAEVLR